MASHGLAQHRFHGIDVDMGILTNITSEHLDYHHTMGEYAATKRLLFSGILANHKPNKIAIFPKDDKYGKKWAEEMHFDRMMSYSIIGTGTLKAENIRYTMDSSTCDIIYM